MKPTHPGEFVPVTGQPERDWLVPSAVMTAGLGLAALLLMPIAGYHHIPDYFSRFVNWLNYMAVGLIFWMIVQLHKLRKAGVELPIGEVRAKFRAHRATTLAAHARGMLAGIEAVQVPELAAAA